MPERDRGPIGIVATGGGARGAYEAGALSVLVPELEARGERPEVFVGSSVGSINALGLAGGRDLHGGEVARRLLARWRGVTSQKVLGSVVFRQLPLTVARYLAEFTALRGVRLPALLDARPLAASLGEWVDWESLHDNVSSGRVRAAACVTTSVRTGRTVVFAETAPGISLPESGRIRYVPARLTTLHARASSAIPLLFPAVSVDDPPEACGWYMDGSTRLIHPTKPALDFGARRLIVVATSSPERREEPDVAPDDEPVDLGDGAANVFQALLADPLLEDVRRLGRANEQHEEDRSRLSDDELARRYPYGTVPFTFVAPRHAHELGEAAAEVFRRRYGGLRAARSPDIWFLDRVLGRGSPLQGELLSWLLFDQEYLECLLDLGRRDANALLAAGDLWRTTPLEPGTGRARSALRR